MTKHRTNAHILVDLLRATNGGPVSLEIIRGVMWRDLDREPEDWVASIRYLACEARRRFMVRIDAVSCLGFIGYRIEG